MRDEAPLDRGVRLIGNGDDVDLVDFAKRIERVVVIGGADAADVLVAAVLERRGADHGRQVVGRRARRWRRRQQDVDTGSGEVDIFGGPGFEFDLDTDLGSGDVSIGYADAELRRDRREIVGARRGSGQTRVTVDTGSGDVTVAPGAGR